MEGDWSARFQSYGYIPERKRYDSVRLHRRFPGVEQFKRESVEGQESHGSVVERPELGESGREGMLRANKEVGVSRSFAEHRERDCGDWRPQDVKVETEGSIFYAGLEEASTSEEESKSQIGRIIDERVSFETRKGL